MAERKTCQTLTSSIHSEDFLSDMELLPATAANTPVKQGPHSQPATPYTSKVTAQLYASLQQSRQAEAQALSHLENQHGLSIAKEAKAPEIDLDTLAEELSLRLSTGVEASAYKKGGAAESRHISEMENVRCHLQSMLRESRDAADGEAIGLGNAERKDDDSFESDSTTALLNARPLQEESPPGSMIGFEELFPRYTSLRFGQVQVREHTSYGDAHHLKDSLGKEQARRKHCERHIHNLQNRILELQQQLAVAISSDKKKNTMIEQLDKTLAKVVEGWNRHEAERTAALRRLQTEKEAVDQALGRQKEKVAELEGQLQQALATLSREQQAASLYRKEKEALEEEKESLSCKLEAADQRACSLEAEWDLERRQQEVLQATLEEQQRSWGQRERQLEQQCQALQEESRAQLDKERATVQREAQKAADAQRVLTAVQAEVQGLESKLETMCRERDSLKMELNLAKARFDAQKVKLESELKVALEERVTERLAEVHEESLRQMSAMREQHRKQLLELSSHHEQELASQLAQFKSDLTEREERHRHLCETYERRLSRQVEEIRELQARQRRLEAQRAEMVSQFQAMMQAHWNEALHLFTCASPQSSAKQDASSDTDRVSDSVFLKPSEPHKKHQNAESLGSSHSGRDCEGPGWTPAIALHPGTQGSSLQGPSEGPEKSMQDSYQHFFPLLPEAGRFSSEFSHILNCSLLSQQGFQQLEAQVDRTRMDAGLPFHPENLAEHPFTDDTDETATEVVGSEGDTPQHSSLESGGQAHQPDLNFCMQLLFDRSSNESCSQKQESLSMDTLQHPVNQTQFATSLSYHERPTALWDASQPPVSIIRIQPSSNAAVHKTKVPLSKAGSACPLEPTSPVKQNPVPEGGILPPNQMAEIARLLKQYQVSGRPVPTTEELYKYLHRTGPNGPEMKSDRNPHARRNLDPKLTEAVRKEAPPTRRTGSAGSGREKSGTSAKSGKKLSGMQGSSSRTSRGGGVWR